MNEAKQKQVQSRVHIHLLLGNSITPDQCRRLYHGDRLAAIVYRLKKRGLNIDKEMVYDSSGGQHAKYFLKKTTKKQRI